MLKMAATVLNVFWETELYNMYIHNYICIYDIYMILHSDVHPMPICAVYWLCSVFCLQTMTYKLDFEQERSDRENLIGRFDEEREALQADITKLNAQLAAVMSEHNDTLAQLQQMKELSLLTKNEVRFKPH